MIQLVERTRISAPAGDVWQLFRELDERYSDWHPEHLRWRTLRGEPLCEGSVIFADEWIGPRRLSAQVHFGFRAPLVGVLLDRVLH